MWRSVPIGAGVRAREDVVTLFKESSTIMAYGAGKALLNRGLLSGGYFGPLAPARAPSGLRGGEKIEMQALRALNARLMREVAVLKEREAKVLELADRDALTGLFNRRRMVELLNGAIAEARRQRHCVGLLFIDLNGFKAINDENGHVAGDELLNTVAGRISARVRAGDWVCRYGGDEFVAVLPNVPDEAAVTRVADAIRQRIALPYWIRGKKHHLTGAIGVSVYPRDGGGAAQLLHEADMAMYRVKARCALQPAGASSAPQQPTRRRDDPSLQPG